MKKQFTLGISLFLIAFISFGQTWTGIGSDYPAPIRQSLIQSTDQSIIIQFNIDGFFLQPVETPQGKQYIVSVPEMVSMSEKSAPDLPIYGVSAIIPDLALMRFRVVNSAYTEFQGIEIAPSKGDILRSEDPSKIPFTYGEMYNQNAFYPEQRGQLQDAFILRDFRGQVVNVNPFAYNPVTKTLRVYHELTVEMFNDGVGGENQFNRDRMPEVMAREFTSIYNRVFINYQQKRYPILEEEGNFLIISHGPYMEAIEPLVEWKKTIGRPTELVNVSSVGTTPAAIKAFVLNYYNTHGLTHLLLVGDHQHVPSQSMSGGFSDYFYGYLVGSDSYNEVFVGRFSAESVADVETQVQRTIHYERDINENETWLNYGIGLARNEGTGNGHYGENDYVHMNFIRDSLLNYTYSVVYRLYDGNVPGVPNTNAGEISQKINEGASIINFCNHGSMTGWSVGGYSISHVNALTNVGKLPFIWSVACDNGRFTSGTCFAEAWMRATHNGQPTGAIATMMSWISQPWQPPMTGQDEMVTILVEQRDHIKRTMGGVSVNGSAKMITMHPGIGQTTHDTWILFGDPTLTLRTDNPTLMTVSHMPTLFLGSTEFVVNADAEGAIVALTMNGEIVGTAYVTGGMATVEFPVISEPGIMTVAVFGWNRVTYLQDIEVIPASGPYIVYASSMIDDNIGGNGNGEIDFGESIVLGVQLRNIGIETANNLNVTLTTTSPYVTITDGAQNYGNILPDQLIMITDAFAFDVAENIPNNTTLPFQLQIAGGDETWNAVFNRVAYAPAFAIGNMTVSDPLGNSNGQADPGETVNLIIPTTNNGNSQAFNLTGVLTGSSPYMTIDVGEVIFESLDAGQTSNAVFTISIDEDTPIGTPIALNYTVTSGAYLATKDFVIQVGLIFDDFETGDFSMFGYSFAGNLPWTITNVGPYEGVYAAKSGAITHSQSSQLILDYDVGAPDSISFYRKVSSEANYDYLKFYINNQMIAQWAGTIPWGRVVFPVTPGFKTFKWEYMKDGSVSTGEDCAWIDYIVFPVPAACPAPVSLHATAVTASTAMLNWSAGGTQNVFDAIWGAAGFDPYSSGTLVEGVAGNSHLLGGLSAVTAYHFYIRAHCDDLLSAWSGPAAFTTLCDIFSLPYTEPFGTPAVTCWSFPQGQGNWGFGNSYTPPSSTSGAPNAFFNWSPSITNYSLSLMSPLFDGTGMLDVKLNYILFVNSYSSATVENMAVEFKALDDVEWTLLENFSNAGLGSGQAEFVRADQELAGMAGNMFQIRFRAHGPNSFNLNGWGLDDISVHGEEGTVTPVPGDSNCDGVVNVLDAITTVNYVMGGSPEPFCWNNADVTGDGVINVLDVIGTVNIIMGGKKTSPFEVRSAAAHLYLNQDGVVLESDGTLAGLQFEISGMGNNNMEFLLNGFEFVTAMNNDKLTGMIFSFDNTPIPAGTVNLFSFDNQNSGSAWGSVVAGNLNAEEVPVIRHMYGRNEAFADAFGLQVFPNPSASHFVIEAEIPFTSETHIRIINMLGSEVLTLHQGMLEKGIYRFETSGHNALRPGVYFLHLQANSHEMPGNVVSKYERLIKTQ